MTVAERREAVEDSALKQHIDQQAREWRYCFQWSQATFRKALYVNFVCVKRQTL